MAGLITRENTFMLKTSCDLCGKTVVGAFDSLKNVNGMYLCKRCMRTHGEILKKKSEYKPIANGNNYKCPYCREEIKADAIKCKYCGEFLDGRGGVEFKPLVQRQRGGCAWIVIIALGILLFFIIVRIM